MARLVCIALVLAACVLARFDFTTAGVSRFVFIAQADPLPTVCEVHNSPLHVRSVRISYGTPAFAPPFREFPHNGAYLPGGCNIGEEKSRLMPVCDECTRGMAGWITERRHGPF